VSVVLDAGEMSIDSWRCESLQMVCEMLEKRSALEIIYWLFNGC